MDGLLAAARVYDDVERPPGSDAMLAQWVVKLGWFTIGNALGFAANVLGVLESCPFLAGLGIVGTVG